MVAALTSAPTDDLVRMVAFAASELRIDAADTGHFEGYGAVFNTPTLIDSWEGMFEETLMPGCFKKTLSERGDRIKIQFDHGMDMRFGSAPIAVPVDIHEDDRGLFVRGRFVETQAGQEARELIRAGAVDGMSIRFSVKREDWTHDPDGHSTRTLREVALFETGPVTWPAYEATTIGIRSADYARMLASVKDLIPAGTAGGIPDGDHDTPPPVAPVDRRRSQTLRRLRASFPEVKEAADAAR